MPLRLPPRALLAGVLTVALAFGGWLWFRDSSLVQVEEVTITGLASSERTMVRAALESAAADMTTLHVRQDALDTAVSQFTSVSKVEAKADFPHALTIHVHEHAPVAALQTGRTRLPVSGSGLILRGVKAPERLPVVNVGQLPSGSYVDGRRPRLALRALAAAPEVLRKRVERAWFGPRGLTLDLRDGPPIVFGDDDAPQAKWAAAARVLADPGAAGATYLDVRVPGRVGAGGLGPVDDETAATTPTPNPQPTVENSPTLNP
jgi:cell division protein FtsQ